eukprot:CAMPEP_0181289932 /NCGR_PEP_ID=MMETSP1101-20121128/1148_1 /TAXON_ID=46948 /ORGANISM="Rhodomonas abbreviata, Strain Caron Lab Isolate" /LENGTH=189 /DNA_ID=CAMNT_0023394191 /DNA_START=90 /DNA_END=656 /DNA_ORIENTATION=+
MTRRVELISVPVFYSLENEDQAGDGGIREVGPDGWVGPLMAHRKINDEVRQRMADSLDMIQGWMSNSGDDTGDYKLDSDRMAKFSGRGGARQVAAQMAIADMEERRENETATWAEHDPGELRWIGAARQWAWDEAAEAHMNNSLAFHQWEEENPGEYGVYPEELVFPPEEYPTGLLLPVEEGGEEGGEE